MYSYSDFKARISIIDVALALGYRFDKTKGHSRPNFVLRGTNGDEIDRIIITNPHDSSQQGYWRRNTNVGRSSGDLISFVAENINKFAQASGRNSTDAINKVLSSFCGEGTLDYNAKTYLDINHIHAPRPFSINRYEREPGCENIENLMRIFSPRDIEKSTVEYFSPYLERVADKESKYNFHNLGFPYCIPGSTNIVGYELRGYQGFKGKAEGSNSSSAAWIVDFSKKPEKIENIYIAESGFDIMAFYQYNKAMIATDKSIFVSTGGSFSDGQIIALKSYYTNAEFIDCFDNDLQGHLYGCRMAALVEGKLLKTEIRGENVIFSLGEREFSMNNKDVTTDAFLREAGLRDVIRVFKAPADFKDWNDVVMGKNSKRAEDKEIKVSKAQHLEQLAEKRSRR